jgi:hypothetical protein
MRRFLLRLLVASILSGLLLVSTASAAAQAPPVAPDADGIAQPIANLVDGFLPGETVYVAF